MANSRGFSAQGQLFYAGIRLSVKHWISSPVSLPVVLEQTECQNRKRYSYAVSLLKKDIAPAIGIIAEIFFRLLARLRSIK
jgi:hypothetical protein